MCVIVYKPADKDLTDQQIESALNKNPDGYGFMALVDGKVVVKKGGIGKDLPNKKKTAEDIAEFMKDYAPFRGLECAIHFRLKSHGAINEENCHPYKVGKDDVYLMHNGVMPPFTNEDDKSKSDTWHFSQHIAEFVDDGWLREKSFSKIMRKLIGTSRIIFLDEQGFYIPHRDAWIEKDGILYSNKNNIIGVETNYWALFENTDVVETTFCPRQNGLDTYFLGNGSKLEVKKVPPKRGQYYNGQYNQGGYPSYDTNKSTIPTGATSQIKSVATDPIPLPGPNNEQIDKIIDSHTAKVPTSLTEWKNLRAVDLEDLVLEEPELVGEAFFDLLHR